MSRSFYGLGLVLLNILLLALVPIACTNNYNLAPLTSSSFSATSTSTSTPTPSGPCNNTGWVSTFAGSGAQGAVNATGTSASFYYDYGLAVDSSDNIYVADTDNFLIRKITSGGVVTTLAGRAGVTGAINATGTSATFDIPTGVAVDNAGNVYVADYGNCLIRKITSAGVVTTLAGTGSAGAVNATGTAASFNYPYGVAVDASGNVYVADYYNDEIREITPGGVVTTVAGQAGVMGSANGTGTSATFSLPTSVAVDASGNLYVADSNNHLIRKISPGGVVTTLAGSGTIGYVNATGTAASFYYPYGVTVDSCGNVYVADTENGRIRKITSGGVVTTLAGAGGVGSVNGVGTVASFNKPEGVVADASSHIFIADTFNNLVREIQ